MFTEAVQTAPALGAGGVQRPLVPSAPHLPIGRPWSSLLSSCPHASTARRSPPQVTGQPGQRRTLMGWTSLAMALSVGSQAEG